MERDEKRKREAMTVYTTKVINIAFLTNIWVHVRVNICDGSVMPRNELMKAQGLERLEEIKRGAMIIQATKVISIPVYKRVVEFLHV